MCGMTEWQNNSTDPIPAPPLSSDHFTLNSSNLEVSDRLIRQVLGFKEIDRPALYFPGKWYALKDTEIHVIGKSYSEGKKVKDLISEELVHYLPVDHIALKAVWEDFHLWYERLQVFGIQLRVDDHHPLRLKQIFFKDVGGSEAQFELNFR